MPKHGFGFGFFSECLKASGLFLFSRLAVMLQYFFFFFFSPGK